jgi:hypothetical protein
MLSVSLLLTAGCSSLSVEHVSTLTHATKGVLLHADGQATTGIGGMVCTVQATGSVDEIGVMEDIDFTDAAEHVQDLHGDRVVASSEEGLHFIEAGVAGESIDLSGVLQARLLDDGVAALRSVDGGCQLEWLGEGASATPVRDGFCAEGAQMTVDPTSKVVYIADGELYRVTPDAEEALGIEARFVDFDASSGVLFAGSGEVVSALVGDTLAWQRTVDGTVTSVAAYSGSGAALVGVLQSNGRGAIRIFGAEGEDSMPNLDEVIPESGGVTASDDGTLIAVILDKETHFFEVCTDDCGPRVTFSPRGDDPVRFLD